MPRRLSIGTTLTAVILAAGVAGAGAPGTFPTGEIVPRVAATVDPARTYALYLPSGYTPQHRWPLLIVMDPRGRAIRAMERFVPAAERFGYVVVSSYDTRSDGPREPNILALRAIFPDTEERLAIDGRRHYLAGFSGTARLAWDVAARLPGRVAGIFGVGAGFPPGFEPPDEMTWVFAGAAGVLDFNHDEMRALEGILDRSGMPHRMESFEGPHAWAPEEICSRAIAWFEIQAMQAHLRPTDRVLAGTLFDEEVERARDLEAAGQVHEAWTVYRDLVRDLAGLTDTALAAARAGELATDPRVVATDRHLVRIAAAHEAAVNRLQAVLQGFWGHAPPPPLVRTLRALDIKNLKKKAAGEDPLDAAFARRELANVFTFTSFYLPRDFIRASASRRALAVLDIAAAIRADDAGVCLQRARAYTQLKQRRKALDALACATSSGRVSRSFIEQDPILAALTAEKGFAAALAGDRH
ncbi:MAG: hypothetical protein ACE5IK_12570 [Acidobacteriota bacterium]